MSRKTIVELIVEQNSIKYRGQQMLISELELKNLNKEQINQLLFENVTDDGQIGDFIMVFGSLTATKYRVPKAVELYQTKRAPKILMSGGTILPDKGISEAIMMKERTIELGVNKKDILLEEMSLNTIENVLASMLILNRELKLEKIKRILIVTTYYHLRRCLLTLKKYMPKWIEYTLCPAIDPVTYPDNWWQNEVGTRKVWNEAQTVIKYVQEGYLEDYRL